MKRLPHLILPIVFLSVSFYTYAIEKDGNEVGGIRFGYQTSALFDNGSKLSGYDNLQSFYVGLFRYNKIIPLIHLGTGIEYFQNGMQEDKDNKWVLHYISLPLNVQVKVGPVFALTGFSPSFKVSEKVFIDGQKSTPDEKSNWFDVPFHVGVGVKILFITIEGRYHWGLLDIKDGLKNQYFQLGAGLSF